MPGKFAALFALITLTACQRGPFSQQPPDEGGAAETPPTAEGAGAEDEDAGAEAEGAGGEDEHGGDGPGAPPGPKLPDGPLCDSDADCGAGMLCEGVGCEPGMGRCVAEDRMCTRDLASYCGCDGQTFQSSGSCPGARFAYRGPCDPKLEDGEPCTDGRQCSSGLCVGEGLEGCSPGAQGVCGQAACTRDLVPYCGCNNTEFRASGTCPNRQFAYRGPCEGG